LGRPIAAWKLRLMAGELARFLFCSVTRACAAVASLLSSPAVMELAPFAAFLMGRGLGRGFEGVGLRGPAGFSFSSAKGSEDLVALRRPVADRVQLVRVFFFWPRIVRKERGGCVKECCNRERCKAVSL
jgi:hypothetical protein